MMGRNSRECNLRWNKRVKSKDGWIVGRSGRSLQEARRLKKTRNRGGGEGGVTRKTEKEAANE